MNALPGDPSLPPGTLPSDLDPKRRPSQDDDEEPCDRCNGSGIVEGRCATCNGSGEGMADAYNCRVCRGAGVLPMECPQCQGRGVLEGE